MCYLMLAKLCGLRIGIPLKSTYVTVCLKYVNINILIHKKNLIAYVFFVLKTWQHCSVLLLNFPANRQELPLLS